MEGKAYPARHLGAREVPVPTSVSPEARAVIAMGDIVPPPNFPPVDRVELWAAWRKSADESTLQAYTAEGTVLSEILKRDEMKVDELSFGEFSVFQITPPGLDPDDRRIHLYVHGALVACGGEVCRAFGLQVAHELQVRVWAVDYRIPPEHLYPAALNDCLAAYRALLDLRQPHEITVGGTSAGGGLSSALMLRLKEEGLPMPVALILETPLTDMTRSGDTLWTNYDLDMLIGDITPLMTAYAGVDADFSDPHLSPLYGDLRGLPPTILTTGTRDRLLSDTCRMHRALLSAGVQAELHVWEAAGHAMFLDTAPEDADKKSQIRQFLERNWNARRNG